MLGAGEIAQWLRALALLTEDLCLGSSIHMAAYNCLQLQDLSICRQNTNAHEIKINCFLKIEC